MRGSHDWSAPKAAAPVRGMGARSRRRRVQKRTMAERFGALFFSAVDTDPKTRGGREERRQGDRLGAEHRLGALHLALLIEVRLDQQLMQGKRGAGEASKISPRSIMRR